MLCLTSFHGAHHSGPTSLHSVWFSTLPGLFLYSIHCPLYTVCNTQAMFRSTILPPAMLSPARLAPAASSNAPSVVYRVPALGERTRSGSESSPFRLNQLPITPAIAMLANKNVCDFRLSIMMMFLWIIVQTDFRSRS